jgi:hypothetical protein
VPPDELLDMALELIRLAEAAGIDHADLDEFVVRWELDRAERYDVWQPRVR